MIVFNIAEHGKAIAKVSGYKHYTQDCPVISRVNDRYELLGGVIFPEFTGSSIEMHVAGFTPKWGSPDMLWVCFHYPFEQLGCKRILAFVPGDNLKALAFDHKLGFVTEAIIPDVYPKADLHVLSMTREQCRWLKIRPRILKDNGCG